MMSVCSTLGGVYPPAVKVHFEHCSVCNVKERIITGLKARLHVKEVKEEECEVKVLFCPIVSRAGTDIEAVLSTFRGDKDTMVMVLHHTIDQGTVIPSSHVYERERLILVDFLFSEDQGLLECPKNNEAFHKAQHYMKRHIHRSPVIECFIGLITEKKLHYVAVIAVMTFIGRKYYQRRWPLYVGSVAIIYIQARAWIF